MVLNQIQALLEKEEYECSFVTASENIPFDRLLVFIGIDDKERERILEIVESQPQVSPEYVLPEGANIPYRLHFRIQLPFEIQDIALNQVASLLLFLNQYIDLPGFELNEIEGKVLYRYVWIMQSATLDILPLMVILGAIMLNLGLFANTIETLADGQMTFNDLLAQIIQTIETSRSPKKNTR